MRFSSGPYSRIAAILASPTMLSSRSPNSFWIRIGVGSQSDCSTRCAIERGSVPEFPEALLKQDSCKMFSLSVKRSKVDVSRNRHRSRRKCGIANRRSGWEPRRR
jgi:hypothetical protein